jgi:hypothetical protein
MLENVKALLLITPLGPFDNPRADPLKASCLFVSTKRLKAFGAKIS